MGGDGRPGYQNKKERLDRGPKDNNARNSFEKHALTHAYMICREKAHVPEAIIADMKRYVELYKHLEWFGYGTLNCRLMNDTPVSSPPRFGRVSEAELARFSDAVIQKARFDVSSIDAERPKLTARALDGTILEITHRPHKEHYKDQHRINGKPVPYDKFPHFGNAWVNQALGGDQLVIRHKGATLSYDFRNWTRTGS